MAEFKGTKGKWQIDKNNSISIIDDSGDWFNGLICQTNGKKSEEQQANALLISKAPEMLEMLKELHSEFIAYKTSAQGTSKCEALIKTEQLIKEATEL